MQKFSKPAIALLLGVTVAGFFTVQYQEYKAERRIEILKEQEVERLASLTFSNTQEWGFEYVAVIEGGADAIELYKPKLTLPSPPLDSAEIEKEIARLKTYIDERTTLKVWEIASEVEVEDAAFDGQVLKESLADKPKTAELINAVFIRFEPVELLFKKEFDRVRPSVYDPSLTITIPLPKHPSYPSYHAADSTLIARMLGELNPEKSEVYTEDSNRISRNREIAGVHYPSDSAAGQKLGNDFFELIREEDWYRELYESAEKEWNKE